VSPSVLKPSGQLASEEQGCVLLNESGRVHDLATMVGRTNDVGIVSLTQFYSSLEIVSFSSGSCRNLVWNVSRKTARPQGRRVPETLAAMAC
jgi:hypothetical protein